ncbi:MAG: tyrosine-type recombinase/integrase [Sterolibacteriaceae bacterium]|uniref:Tyrosine-type recombinase/integrase n=1 Tax=Candidatus Methylophosphatis roskildensis TaxID=2899263 RepID=A0A9D7E3P6_9PROT|nr:tyrosine-type recombinase/integrase [Candidatus Methylophosphatis roskildensis]MBK7238189.1 tyrosine-type recombinase/integrase [Sterolibacteriaceae bacterium]
MSAPGFPALLQSFSTGRLMQRRQVSSHMIASYRDGFRLLLHFAQQRLSVPPQGLTFEQIDAPLVAAFLDDLQDKRGIGAGSRNLRLTAIRSFFRYASFEMPTNAAQIQRVLAIPSKRCSRAQIGFLTREEVDALLRAPDLRTLSGRRDHALMLLAVQTGLRLSEITGLCRRAFCLSTGAHVRVVGKGRKERSTPLTKTTANVLRAWVREIADADDAIVFPSARGTRLSADGVQYLLSKHVERARQGCPSLRDGTLNRYP